jgi:predicted nucleic acid-binding protein
MRIWSRTLTLQLAIEHGLILCSTDGDFGRFRNLRWQNPLST